MRKTSRPVGPGFSITGMIFVAFLILRLTHVDEWSWWWVTSPLWLPWVIVPGAMIVRVKRFK